MSRDQHEAVRAVFDQGWGHPATRIELPPMRTATAFVANQDRTTITVKPIAVVDFYADEKEGTHDAQRLRRHP